MKILITGSTGFIGHHLVRHFLDAGWDVSGTYRRELHNEIEGCRYLHVDLAKDKLTSERYDCVIHCAGQVEGGLTWDHVNNTVIATKKLIDNCEKTGTDRFILFSSIAVYGECSGLVNEDTKGTNLNSYALCKLLNERILKDSSISCRTVLRLSRILGEGGFDNSAFLAKFVRQLMSGETLEYTNGQMPYNNLFHVSDLVNICEIMAGCNESYQCLGTGSDEPVCMEKLVKILKDELNSESVVVEKSSDAPITCHEIDISKMKGFYQPMSTEQTLRLFAQEAIKQFR